MDEERQPRSAVLVVVALAVVLGSCRSGGAETRSAAPRAGAPPVATAQATRPPPGPGMGRGTACPMAVPGSDVAVEETEEGVALIFTTDSGDVADLRSRVHHLARMYEMHRGRGQMRWHQMRRGPRGGMGRGGGMGMGRGPGPMPAATARVEEIDRGARLLLTPVNAAELESLRTSARWHGERMQSGACPRYQRQPAPPTS